MMLSGNTNELKDLITTNFSHKLVSYQSLVLTRISPEFLMVDEPNKKIGIISDMSLQKQYEIEAPQGNPFKCVCLVKGGNLFVGHANGILTKQDSETLEV